MIEQQKPNKPLVPPQPTLSKEEIRRQMYERIARGYAVGTSDCQAKNQLHPK